MVEEQFFGRASEAVVSANRLLANLQERELVAPRSTPLREDSQPIRDASGGGVAEAVVLSPERTAFPVVLNERIERLYDELDAIAARGSPTTEEDHYLATCLELERLQGEEAALFRVAAETWRSRWLRPLQDSIEAARDLIAKHANPSPDNKSG